MPAIVSMTTSGRSVVPESASLSNFWSSEGRDLGVCRRVGKLVKKSVGKKSGFFVYVACWETLH